MKTDAIIEMTYGVYHPWLDYVIICRTCSMPFHYDSEEGYNKLHGKCWPCVRRTQYMNIEVSK